MTQAGITDPVFPVPDGTDTPIIAQGWTVQTSDTGSEGGSDQGTVTGESV